GIRGFHVTGVQTCALPLYPPGTARESWSCEHAADREVARVDVPAREGGVVDPELGGRPAVLREHDVAEAGSVLLDETRDRLRMKIGRASCRVRGGHVVDCR